MGTFCLHVNHRRALHSPESGHLKGMGYRGVNGTYVCASIQPRRFVALGALITTV